MKRRINGQTWGPALETEGRTSPLLRQETPATADRETFNNVRLKTKRSASLHLYADDTEVYIADKSECLSLQAMKLRTNVSLA